MLASVKTCMLFPLLLAIIASIVSADRYPDTITYTKVTCRTAMQEGKGKDNSHPVMTRTTTFTTRNTMPIYIRSTTTTTITPAAQTVTDTATTTVTTTTTDSAVTDILTVSVVPTSTATTTSTATVTTTSVTSTTTTTSTATTTIPTQAGYTPLSTQITSAGQTPYRRRNQAAPGAGSLLARGQSNSQNAFCHKGKHLKPKAVYCTKKVKVTTFTTITLPSAKTQTITAAASTSTAKATSTVTSTTTVALPDVSVTVTDTQPATTITTTTTTTATTTQSTQATATASAQETVYAACQADNMVSKINGKYINGGSGGYNQNIMLAASAKDCCISCQTTANCVFFAFSNSASGQCLVFTPAQGTCPLPYTLYSSVSTSLTSSFTIGNSVCGGYYSS